MLKAYLLIQNKLRSGTKNLLGTSGEKHAVSTAYFNHL